MQDRTDTEPTALYTFVGLAEIRASHETPDFLVCTSVEPHEDGTVRICEASCEGTALVWGESSDGSQIWGRENDDVARAAIATWEATDAMAQARQLSRDAEKL